MTGLTSKTFCFPLPTMNSGDGGDLPNYPERGVRRQTPRKSQREGERRTHHLLRQNRPFDSSVLIELKLGATTWTPVAQSAIKSTTPDESFWFPHNQRLRYKRRRQLLFSHQILTRRKERITATEPVFTGWDNKDDPSWLLKTKHKWHLEGELFHLMDL